MKLKIMFGKQLESIKMMVKHYMMVLMLISQIKESNLGKKNNGTI
jgi:hypothetical protein